jgi:hypothetical protein
MKQSSKKTGYAKGGLKPAPNKGAASLPKAVRNKMGFMNKGGMSKKKKGYALLVETQHLWMRNKVVIVLQQVVLHKV